MRLDQIISSKYKITRSLAGKYISNSQIKVNGTLISSKKYQINQHDKIEFIKKIPKIKILYEDNNFAIVYKPENMSVCRTFNTPKIESVLNEELKKIMPLSNAQKEHEFGLPHRLDKQTEGLIIISKTDDFYDFISLCFQKFLVKKQYFAFHQNINFNFLDIEPFVCEHNYINFSKFEKGCLCNLNGEKTIIKYDESKEKIIPYSQQTVLPKEMITEFEFFDNYSKCYPITGVRHQIRFSLSQLNKGIHGDSLYSSGHIEDKLLLFSTFISFPVYKIPII